MSNIKVAVRVRPPIESELCNGDQPSWITYGNTICMQSGKISASHTFDHVFDWASTNRDVYDKYCHPIVESVMQGFNGTIFAFGQTSSGKTHTMMGTSSQPGLIPLAINAIFNIIENVPEREYLIRVSYIEIYNENIMDLLDPTNGKNLQIRDNADGQPIIVDLTELTVGSKDEIRAAMNTGERHRHVASTDLNQRSSRSHTIFRMVIESSLRDESVDRAVTVGQLNLVDLAGSERSEQCGEAGERFRESTRINLSLTFLTQVISRLSRGERGHINFRDSKLTRILRNSLGGNAHTAIVCTVNPFSAEQTLRTLQFASSAKKIQNTPVVNESVSNDTLIRSHHLEIERLKRQIKAMKENDMSKTLQEKDSLIDELNSKVRSLEQKLVVSTLPAPSTAEWRKQRRETWAAPSSLQHDLAKARTASESMMPCEPLDIFQELGRLSTVVEENESFHAISTEKFEEHLQKEERTRRSAALHLGDSEPATAHTCNDVSCAERMKFLENEVMILKKDYEELKELTTLERLMCNTSRRPASSGKLDEAGSTPPLPGQLKKCCVEALLTSKLSQERVSRRPGGFKFFSPLYASPLLPSADWNDSTSSSSHEDQEGECVQASKQCARLTPRTTLWTPGHSPVVGTPGTPSFNPLTRTPQASKLLCVDGATQTEDVQCMQMSQDAGASCTRTHEDGMLQSILPVVDASCQTDSKDGCEKPSPSTGGQPGATADELVDHSASCTSDTCKKTPTQILQVQTVDLYLAAPQEFSAKPKLAETPELCCQDFEQHVDCGTQTETPTGSLALQLEDGDTEWTIFGSGDRQSLRRHCALHEKQRREINSCTYCGSRAYPGTEDTASQVNRSLVDGSVADFAAQATTQMQSCASQMDVQLYKEVVDCAVQYDSPLQNCEAREKAIDAVDCEAQTTLSVQECMVQTELSLLHRNVADYGVQAMPSMLDAATEVDQVSRIMMLDAGVQTASPCCHDRSMQSEGCVLSEALADCEVQAVPFTKDSASQVNSSLESQEICRLESTRLSFAINNSSHLDKSLASQVGTSSGSGRTSSGSGSMNDWNKLCHRRTVWDAVRESMLESSEKSAGNKTLRGDCQSTPSLSCRNDVVNSQKKAFALGTQTMTKTEEQVPRICLVDASVQTKPSSHDRSTQSMLSIPRSSVADCNIQDVLSTSDRASQDVSTSESAQCSASHSCSQLQKTLVSEPSHAASKPPTYPAWMSTSGNGTHLQQSHRSGGKIMDALRANLCKPAEDSTANRGSQKLPTSFFNGATSSFQSGTSASEIRTLLHRNQKAKESVAVQADTSNNQELEDLRKQVCSMKLSLDAHEQALRHKESQWKLEEKASKKREVQLKAVIRQLQNRDADNMARAAHTSPTVAASAKDEAQPPLSAKAMVHESPVSLAQRLKAMTPRAREGARLIYFGSNLEEQAVVEQVQMGQLRASHSAHARKLESARKRQQAWLDLRSDSKHTVQHSPLEEFNTGPGQEIKDPAGSVKDADTVNDMELWPPLKYFMDADKENKDSP